MFMTARGMGPAWFCDLRHSSFHVWPATEVSPPFSSCRKVNEDKTVLVMVKQLQESVDKLEVLRAEVRVLAPRA